VKAQFLVDFLTELPKIKMNNNAWKLQIDDSSNKKGSGTGIILEGSDEIMLEQSIRFTFETSNNQAEYETLIAGLRLARELGVKKVNCMTDSELITRKIKGDYQTKELVLQKYHQLASSLISDFKDFVMTHIPREQNNRADVISKLASKRKPGQHRTLIQETLNSPSWDSDGVFQLQPGR